MMLMSWFVADDGIIVVVSPSSCIVYNGSVYKIVVETGFDDTTRM